MNTKYRRQGVRVKLREKIINEAKNRGWLLFFSFPNKIAYLGAIKRGYLDVCKISTLLRVLQPREISQVIKNEQGMVIGTAVNIISRLNLLRFSKTTKILSKNDLNIVEEKDFDESYDDFWERVSQYLNIAIIRDRKYLNWRYRDNPVYQYTVYMVRKNDQLLGFTILGSYKEKYKAGKILEFLVLPDQLEAAEMLLAQANNFFAEKSMDIIQCMAQNPFLPKTLYRKYGYIKNPVRKINFTTYPLVSEIPIHDLTVKKNWLVSIGEYATS